MDAFGHWVLVEITNTLSICFLKLQFEIIQREGDICLTHFLN